jgi:hypothetical protein
MTTRAARGGCETVRRRTFRTFVAVAALLAIAGCRNAAPVDCDQVPTTADGCRERCHDRGAEMVFFRFDPGTYRCDAACECSGGSADTAAPR